MSTVDVKYGSLSAGNRERPVGVGCTCSGGVDSFYSIFKHLPRNEPIPDLRVTHCLIVNGFNWDVDLDQKREFSRVFESRVRAAIRHRILRRPHPRH